MFKKILISKTDLAKYLGLHKTSLTLWKERGNKVPMKHARNVIDYLDKKTFAISNLREQLEKQIFEKES